MTIECSSKRKLFIKGNGWHKERISLKYIVRHSCSGGILEEKDFEFEEDRIQFKEQYLSFSNSMTLILKNLDSGQVNIFEFKDLKKEGIYQGDLNPEDLILTNSFEKIPKFCINHWEHEDENYYIDSQNYWKGIYGIFTFEKGEVFDIKKLKINVTKLDTGYDFYEWVCQVKYKGKFKEDGKMIKSNRKKRLLAISL
tara:strand:- start:31 stop:621 length:591 start_codon:yes stop_codon:yes gene_type:complete